MAVQIIVRSERSAAALALASQSEARARPVSVVSLAPSDWEEWRSYYGEVRAVKTMEVTSYVREIVEAVHVDVGDRVSAGQLLLSLQRDDEAADSQAKGAAYEEAKANYNRLLALNNAGGVSKAEVDRAYSAMRAEMALSRSSGSALRRTKLHSKISGVVTARHVEPGEVAEAGLVLLSIEGASELEARLMVSMKDIGRISADTPVRIIRGGLSLDGRVKHLTPSAEAGSGLYPVTVSLDPGAGVLPGAQVEGVFLVHMRPGAIVIPAPSLFNRGDERFVYVASSDAEGCKARLTKIETGGGGGGKVLVTSGLYAGDMLIVSGNRGLSDGLPVSLDIVGASD
jgi:RND family efflux transporter MFP subunit